MESATKVCTKCKRELPATVEYFHRQSPSGLRQPCKECRRRGEVRTRPGERRCRQCGEWKPATEEFFWPRGTTFLARCKDCVRKANHRWYESNREKRIEYFKRYYRANKPRVRLANQRWVKDNWQAVKNRCNAYRRARLQKDPAYRLNHAFRSNVWSSIKSRKGGRSWETLVGYTLEELMAHLESQFKKGMSWANYGRAWHVDHRRPIASFTFNSPDDPEFTECWALHNLQPMWAKANIRKGDKWDGQLVFPLVQGCRSIAHRKGR